MSEFDQSFTEKCKELDSLCINEAENARINQLNTNLHITSTQYPANYLYPNIDYHQPSVVHQPHHQLQYNQINSYVNHINPYDCNQFIGAADVPKNFNCNQQSYVPYQTFDPNHMNSYNNNNNINVQSSYNSLPIQNGVNSVYNSGAIRFESDTNFNIHNKNQLQNQYHFTSPIPSPLAKCNVGNQIYCAKNFARTNNRKYLKFPPRKENTSSLEFDIESETKKLQICSEIKSNFLTLVLKFRHLSVYAMEMCRERISLDSIINGYDSINNYHLPTVISNISSHIKVIKQSLSYEFYEIIKLIDSIETIKYQKEHENNVRIEFEKNLKELDQFDDIKIKQKNGEILLSNEKINDLETMVEHLIDCVRYYSMYITVLQFKYNQMQVNNFDKKDISENLETEKTNDSNTLQYHNSEFGKIEKTFEGQQSQIHRQNRRNVGF